MRLHRAASRLPAMTPPSPAPPAPVSDPAASLAEALRAILPALRAFPVHVGFAAAMLVAAKLAAVALPLVLKELVDTLDAQRGAALALPLALLVGYGALRFANVLFGELRDVVFGRVSERAMRRAGLAVFEQLHRLDLEFHLSRRSGALARDIERGVEGIGFLLRFALFTILPTLLELAAHYRFEPRPVAVYRGNEKGRVERAIRYVRDAFFAARSFRDLADLNAQADAWCQGPAAERLCPEDRTRTVRAVFEEEKPRLLSLPDNPFPAEERLEVSVSKTPYARFDLNDYTVPHTHVRRTLTVLATLDTVRILDGQELIATHVRSFERGAQIEIPAHIAELVKRKRAARGHRAQDRLHHAARGAHLGVLTRGLITLLDSHGASALEAAINAALAEDAAHLGAVRHFIDSHAHARGQRPPLAVVLPDDPRLQAINVRPQPLSDYEQLTAKANPK